MISEDTHNKLIALGLHKDAFNNYFYKNHPKSFIFHFEDMCCCIYDFTLKKNSKSENLKMTFETYANRLVKRLEHLGYISHKYGKYLSFYLPNYNKDLSFNSDYSYLFSICYGDNTVKYVEDINDTYWSIVDYYDYESLNHLYNLANQYLIKAKEQNIKNKWKELENDFQ